MAFVTSSQDPSSASGLWPTPEKQESKACWRSSRTHLTRGKLPFYILSYLRFSPSPPGISLTLGMMNFYHPKVKQSIFHWLFPPCSLPVVAVDQTCDLVSLGQSCCPGLTSSPFITALGAPRF